MKKHSPSFDVAGISRDCIAVRVRLLNRVLTNLYDEELRPLGLTVSQLNILVLAANLGLARSGEVCQILHLDGSTLSRNIERLRAKGWVETVASEDQRARPFRLTREGEKMVKKAAPLWESAQEKARDVLGPEAEAALRTVADRLLEGAKP